VNQPNSTSKPGWIRKAGRFLLNAYHQLKPCGFGIAMAVLAFFVFVYSDQGAEVLRALSERRFNQQDLTGATGVVRLMAFVTGTLLWCLASWYTARVLLYVNLPATQHLYVEEDDNWSAGHLWLARNVPRILGAAPLAIIGYSMLRAVGTYEVDPPILLRVLGVCALAGSVALWWAFYKRREIMERNAKNVLQQQSSEMPAAPLNLQAMAFDQNFLRSIPKQRPEKYRASQVRPITELKSAHRVLLVAGTVSLLPLLAFTLDPIHTAGAIGTGTVITLAGASWVLWGSALVYWGERKRIPVLTLLLLLAVVSSIWNDNHNIRVLNASGSSDRDSLETALSKWHDQISKKYSDRSQHPLFIVTAEGGGIRAAYWTSIVLGSLQDKDPSFADHVFAISGVSGGSVGAAVFSALLTDENARGQIVQRSEEILGQDFLSSAIAAMLYPDFAQRFCPIPIQLLDRGQWMEKSWEQAWRETARKHGHDDNRLAEGFRSLWKQGNPYVPVLFLNATSVERGNRVIVSNIRINPDEFLASDDLMNKIAPAADVPLSTAAHLSARFTYVSPAARFVSDNSHAVDGGYFENSGATTGVDILRKISLLQNDPDPNKRAIVAGVAPKVIMISNSPVGTAFWKQTCPDKNNKERKNPTIERELNHHKPTSLLEDALAPVYALLNTRDARGVYAQRAIGYVNNGFSADPKKQVYFFSLAQTTVPLPLGWMLSNRAADAMQLELFDQRATASGRERITDCYGQNLTWNTEESDLILGALQGR
jgi:predicted acylesterase/phospholipase RssA